MSDLDVKTVWAQAYDHLRALDSAHRLRRDVVSEKPEKESGAHRKVGDQTLVSFCSNDYLDLAHHPDVKKAAIAAVKDYGSGCMASRLICGTLPIHHDLEDELAKFKNAESALVFSSGYLASLGVIQALSMRTDDSRVPIIFDRLSHASLIDGAMQERKNWRSYPHNDIVSLEMLLQQVDSQQWPSALVVTEGIFSMDGDVAPLREMSDLCKKYRALLIVDDAHGTGVMGENGQGTATVAGIAGEPHVVQIGTLSKALGSQGGFVVGPKILREMLINLARTFIFDTGLNPAAAGAALAALHIIKKEPERREKLHSNIMLFRGLIGKIGCDKNNPTPIIPVFLSDEQQALKSSQDLQNKGFFVKAIRPPTVPYGTSRLRITISSAHTEKDIRRLAQAISMLQTV